MELNEIIDICNALVERVHNCGEVQTGDELYERYKNRINTFCEKYNINEKSPKLICSAFTTIKSYYWKRNYTVNIKEAEAIMETVKWLKSLLFPNLYEMIFISHREVDKAQVDALIELLHAIGIPRLLQNGQPMIFCSSHPSAYIENGKMIDKEIMKQFHSNQNTFFILWYTNNYFESQACLNEMGAIWVMNKTYQEILIPGFERNKIGGLLPKTKISFYANEKPRLNGFKKQIEEMFCLQPIDENVWEIARDKFIRTIQELTLP